ncbi:NUDIX hydrolase [Sporosarcina aquimarina]|uniref:NUDIX hydrolase n=1 Tax=Sporosarcina aquimarina TaxID=114975 RepID=UPI00203F68D2|nr:NUDIX hydrolase [Sporosarcina aquimarina]MCM3756358.1 NUDIX hydrolase [Sporosarcina aquimarina]
MDYIQNMRKLIGHETLFTVGCGVMIVQNDLLLLQHRSDEDSWCIPGGVMELGETFEETAKREALEETGLSVDQLELFGIYSGEDCYAEYRNGDQVYSVQVIFSAHSISGVLLQKGEESRKHRFFAPNNLPDNLNLRQKSFILDWARGAKLPVIR